MDRKWRCIVVDPPWEYPEGFCGRDIPYCTMTLDEIKALPIKTILMREGYLFLWATNKYLEKSFRGNARVGMHVSPNINLVQAQEWSWIGGNVYH